MSQIRLPFCHPDSQLRIRKQIGWTGYFAEGSYYHIFQALFVASIFVCIFFKVRQR
jgi:hypothetical protein